MIIEYQKKKKKKKKKEKKKLQDNMPNQASKTKTKMGWNK